MWASVCAYNNKSVSGFFSLPNPTYCFVAADVDDDTTSEQKEALVKKIVRWGELWASCI